MRSLLYLLRKSLKNSLLELRRQPGKLISYLLLVGLLVFTALAGRTNSLPNGEALPLSFLQGALFLFLCLFAVIAIRSGLSSGNTFFEMSDVNLLFVSPISPRSILLYGIVRLMKIAFLAGFFLLFQVSTLSMFGVDYGGVVLICACFVLANAVLTILSVVIYSCTNGNPGRKRLVVAGAAVLVAPLVVFFGLELLRGADLLTAVSAAAGSPLLSFIPVAGWAAAGAVALVSGQTLTGLLWLLGVLGLGVAATGWMSVSRLDYYEDVLCATESAFEKKRAITEGDVNSAFKSGTTARAVRVKGEGLQGDGARVFLFKHLRESFRENRFGPFSLLSVLTIAGAITLSALLRGELSPLTLLAFLAWMQVMLVGLGRGLRELYSHYIYLVPASAFSKLLWINLEQVVRTLVESVAIFVPVGILAGSSLLESLLTALCYFLFVFALVAINYLSLRWTKTDMGRGVLLLLYFVAVLVLMAPGLVAAIVVGIFTQNMPLALLTMAAWEVALGLLCFYGARGILHNCDMPVMKIAGQG